MIRITHIHTQSRMKKIGTLEHIHVIIVLNPNIFLPQNDYMSHCKMLVFVNV